MEERGFLGGSMAMMMRLEARGMMNDAIRSVRHARRCFESATYYAKESPVVAAEYFGLALNHLEMAEFSRKRARGYRRAARGGAF